MAVVDPPQPGQPSPARLLPLPLLPAPPGPLAARLTLHCIPLQASGSPFQPDQSAELRSHLYQAAYQQHSPFRLPFLPLARGYFPPPSHSPLRLPYPFPFPGYPAFQLPEPAAKHTVESPKPSRESPRPVREPVRPLARQVDRNTNILLSRVRHHHPFTLACCSPLAG